MRAISWHDHSCHECHRCCPCPHTHARTPGQRACPMHALCSAMPRPAGRSRLHSMEQRARVWGPSSSKPQIAVRRSARRVKVWPLQRSHARIRCFYIEQHASKRRQRDWYAAALNLLTPPSPSPLCDTLRGTRLDSSTGIHAMLVSPYSMLACLFVTAACVTCVCVPVEALP